MSWQQHRYAVERARDRLRKMVDSINSHCMDCGLPAERPAEGGKYCLKPTLAGSTLQGVAGADDADMLDDVADFLRQLDGMATGGALAKTPPVRG